MKEEEKEVDGVTWTTDDVALGTTVEEGRGGRRGGAVTTWGSNVAIEGEGRGKAKVCLSWKKFKN